MIYVCNTCAKKNAGKPCFFLFLPKIKYCFTLVHDEALKRTFHDYDGKKVFEFAEDTWMGTRKFKFVRFQVVLWFIFGNNSTCHSGPEN